MFDTYGTASLSRPSAHYAYAENTENLKTKQINIKSKSQKITQSFLAHAAGEHQFDLLL